ncbi:MULTISPECIES: UTP--glucose-1-phosphate uridylyltransferase [unclassified Halomonas]|uniref:UTP--glucose-1-phosphate uridylyltransferase n=1 Tax=unclassified Halomonas TaxID=2609666 RepID=UPI0021E42224|nr:MULTISPECIES: UTP--glucose-1-phosphate uridylyltransferase [unclassified Halomonas]UYF98698.1 UTP--glucose-1-phosphate uridylyltransferase [Halomonas sp. GD1P12]WNL40190.1 UTP--glucose-1-phosphate uridylyltransferase [Halomonas sp. PAMB 3232]WNL43501.1 UTP--glucose-1-phosphate uridylyltransferase [Halomonas sp. PAMB 3264]
MTQVRKAIIPVAGFGTRLLPISKAIPKEMVPVVDRPLIQHVVEEALAAGINEIILVTRTGKSAIEDHFDAHFELEYSLSSKGKDAILETLSAIAPPKLRITSVRQANAKGLGHAIHCAAHLLDEGEPFSVILPDVLVKPQVGSQECDLGSMIERWNAQSASQIMVEAVAQEEVYRYGIVDCDEPNAGESANMRGVVEKPKPEEAPSRLSVIGRYVLPYRIMELLADQPPGAGNEIQLTDAIDRLMQEGQTVQAFRMHGRTFDCGHIEGWLQANTTLAREAGFDI